MHTLENSSCGHAGCGEVLGRERHLETCSVKLAVFCEGDLKMFSCGLLLLFLERRGSQGC